MRIDVALCARCLAHYYNVLPVRYRHVRIASLLSGRQGDLSGLVRKRIGCRDLSGRLETCENREDLLWDDTLLVLMY